MLCNQEQSVITTFLFRAIGEKLFANSGKKRYNEFEVKKDVKH